MSKLVICEKPSVAQSIGKVLGASKRCDGYLEGGGYIVSWCVGHLVELAQPEAYGETYAKWRLEDLPILPEKWRYQVSPSTKKQFQVLKGLMGREDVTSIVEATDAGREGELIFRLVYHQCKCKKPFERLWISSMEDAAIREGFARLRPGTEYDALYEAALCRERADWIVGINATRLFSCKYGPTLNVGRVMTPTLAMVCGREAAISGFQSEPFYTVQLVPEGFAANGERMKEKTEAEKIAEFRLPNGGKIEVEYPDRTFSAKCEYIDDYHTYVGSEVYHICQFAEVLERGGGVCRPEPVLDAEQAAWKIGGRAYLAVECGAGHWDYHLYDEKFNETKSGELEVIGLSINEVRDMVLFENKLERRSMTPTDHGMLMEKAAMREQEAQAEKRESVLGQLSALKAGAKEHPAPAPAKKRDEASL